MGLWLKSLAKNGPRSQVPPVTALCPGAPCLCDIRRAGVIGDDNRLVMASVGPRGRARVGATCRRQSWLSKVPRMAPRPARNGVRQQAEHQNDVAFRPGAVTNDLCAVTVGQGVGGGQFAQAVRFTWVVFTRTPCAPNHGGTMLPMRPEEGFAASKSVEILDDGFDTR